MSRKKMVRNKARVDRSVQMRRMVVKMNQPWFDQVSHRCFGTSLHLGQHTIKK